jgi:hypothetical protein
MRRSVAGKKGKDKFGAVDAGVRNERLGDRGRRADQDSRNGGEKRNKLAS